MKMRFSRLVVQNNAQKQMTKVGFKHKSHDFIYVELGNFLCSLNSLQIYQFNVI